VTPALQAAQWCDRVWGDRRGHFFFAFGVGGHFTETGKYDFERWIERSGRWPDDRDRFLADAIDKAAECDVYVAPYSRSNASRKKGNALPSPILYADVDQLDGIRGFARALIGPGGLLVDSGNGLHPYLHFPVELEPAELEEWNRRLARVLQADAGWAENKVLRLPGTWNHKGRARGESSTPVRLLEFPRAPKDWTLLELADLLPDWDQDPWSQCPGQLPASSVNGDQATIEPAMPEMVPGHLLARLDEEPADGSTQSFAFVRDCIRAGLDDAATLALALQHRPTQEKYGPDRRAGEIVRSIRKVRAAASPVAEKSDSVSGPIEIDRAGIENQVVSGGGGGQSPPAGSPENPLPFQRLDVMVESAPAEPEWTWRGYLALFVVALLAGRPKVGKSTLVMALVAAAVRGDAFVGLPAKARGVLLLTEERRDTLAEKARSSD
jgi:hypothetical protein